MIEPTERKDSDRIHKRVYHPALNDDGSRKSWQGIPENHFWEHIEWLMADCESILKELGYPRSEEMVFYAVGYGWLYADSEPVSEIEDKIKILCERRDIETSRAIWEELGKPRYATALGYLAATELDNVFQEAWYAGKIFSLCRSIIENRDSSYTGHLTRIYQIAEFEKDREWRRDFGRMIIRDIKGQEGRVEGGRVRGNKTKPINRKIVQEMREHINNQIEISVAAQIVFLDGIGASEGANRQVWYRYKDRY